MKLIYVISFFISVSKLYYEIPEILINISIQILYIDNSKWYLINICW